VRVPRELAARRPGGAAAGHKRSASLPPAPGRTLVADEHGGATWLQVTSLAGTSQARPVVNEDVVAGTDDTGPAWGYHAYEYGLTLGNLLQDVAAGQAAWQAHH
jgi:hypothetical protein